MALSEFRPAHSGIEDAVSSVPHYCFGCGAEVGSRQIYCGDCGLRLSPEAAGVTFAAPPVVDERKRVTVLFADVVASTALISRLDLEQAASRLDPILRDMATAVTRHGGFVSRLQGDGIKAVFGIPSTLEDHAERACASALQIRAMARKGGARVRIGLHSGEVLARQLRTEGWTEYDAVGKDVHLAARLEQAAQPGSIYLSAATASLVSGRFRLRSVGQKSARGIVGPIEVFQLVAEANRTRWAARSHKGLRDFVGRSDALESLVRLLRSDEPVVCVTGEAGSGKSRLLHELARSRELAQWTVLRADVESEDIHAGLRPFAQMLRSWLRVERHEAPEQVRSRLHAHLMGQRISATDACALQCLLDVGGSQAYGDKNQLMQALVRLIVRHAERHPTLLIIEDVHWLDRDVQPLLSLLSQAAKADRLAVIMTCRLNGAPVSGVHYSLTLDPLSPDESRRLLDARLGSFPALETLKSRILERAGGIPLFIEELAKLSMEAVDPETVVPDGVHAVIGERIDRLPRTARDVLRTVSVIGREAPLSVVCRVMACSESELMADLRQLEAGGFIELRRGSVEPCLEFRHVLTRDVALASLLTNARRVIQAAVLDAYEVLYAARLDELVERLGAHAVEAEAWEKAEHYFRKSAQKAIDRSLHASAIRFVELGLQALSKSSLHEKEKTDRELALRLLLRTAYNAIGNYRDRLGNLSRAEVLARTFDRERFLPTIWVSRASALLNLGQPDAAIRLLETARKTAAERGDLDSAVAGGYMMSRTYFYAGQLIESLTIGEDTAALLQAYPGSQRHGGGFGASRVMLLTQLTQTRAHLGRFAEGRTSAAEALAIAHESERSFDVALATYGLGVVHLLAGDAVTAIPQLEKAVSASLTEGAQSIHAGLVAMLGYAVLCAGKTAEASTLAKRALSHPEKSLYIANWPRLFGSLILRACGELELALKVAEAAHRVARKAPYPVQLAWSELVLGYFYRDLKARVAERHFARALEQAQRLHVGPCVARALMEISHLKSTASRHGEAQTLCEQATALAREMGLADATHLAFR